MTQTPTVTDRRTCPKCGGPKDRRSTHCAGCVEGRGKAGPRPHTRGPRLDIYRAIDRAIATSTAHGDDCLLVTAWAPMPSGYVRGPRVDERNPQMVHRLIVEHKLGRRLLAEETVDHLCHSPEACVGGPSCPHRRCINPNHLGLADSVENWRRGAQGVVAQRRALTHCPAGHPYEEANLRSGCVGRACKACHRARRAGRDPRLEPTYLH